MIPNLEKLSAIVTDRISNEVFEIDGQEWWVEATSDPRLVRLFRPEVEDESVEVGLLIALASDRQPSR